MVGVSSKVTCIENQKAWSIIRRLGSYSKEANGCAACALQKRILELVTDIQTPVLIRSVYLVKRGGDCDRYSR